MTRTLFRNTFPSLLTAAALALVAPTVLAQAPAQHAHVHGKAELSIAVDGPAVTIGLEAPLDSLLGFERAPRTDVEKNSVEQLAARLRAADHLFKLDAAAGCKLGPVQLDSPVIGLGQGEAPGDGHADLDASFAFNCANTAKVKAVDTELFEAFPNLRQIEVEIAAPEGQFRRSLKRPATRIEWSK
ncbi:MAG: DUF2796 domain-containing protein [Xenophilus sp.]